MQFASWQSNPELQPSERRLRLNLAPMRQFQHFIGLTILLALAAPVFAQETRLVPVDDHAMRVQIAGLELLGKVPTVIFESGGGGWSVGSWDPIFADIAKAAPVV